jgi:hypothetical protein
MDDQGRPVAGTARRVVEVHTRRARRERFGELLQWDTSEHDWTEGRGEKMYRVSMLDDATSRVFARFVRHDSMEENMAVLEQYLGRSGRPLEFYTDKASIFYTTPKKNHPVREEPLPATQMGHDDDDDDDDDRDDDDDDCDFKDKMAAA